MHTRLLPRNPRVTDGLPSVALAVWLLLLGGCQNLSNHQVIATTATVIGVEIAQAPTGTAPQAKLGYNRAEFALVPATLKAKYANGKKTEEEIGAADSAEVLMELRYGNIFNASSSGIYQRLAVGKIAVTQAGAALMFAKDAEGKIDEKTAQAIGAAVKASDTPSPDSLALRDPLVSAYLELQGDAAKKALFDQAVKPEFADFVAFTAGNPTVGKIKSVRTALEQDEAIKTSLATHTH